MRRLWKQLNYKVIHQVYLQVLPVVVLSVLLVGGTGWLVFTRHEISNRTEVDALKLQGTLETMFLKTVEETLARDSNLVSTGVITGKGKSNQVPDLSVAVSDDSDAAGPLKGVCLIGFRNEAGPGLVASHLEKSLAGILGQDELAGWVAANARFLGERYHQGSWGGARAPGVPCLVESASRRPIYIFPPMLAGEWLAGDNTALVPVLVRGDGDDDRFHTLYLFGAESLARGASPDNWWCLLDSAGRILGSAGGDPPTGSLLAAQSPQPDHPVLASVRGSALLEAVNRPEGNGRGRISQGILPWLVLRAESPQPGLAMLVVDRMDDLRAVSWGYLWAIFLGAFLALSGTVWGIHRVMHRTSDQLATLAGNMEALARGDYSGRMPGSRKDEVGTLIGYFNLMAVSLDEAHRQVKEKAAHLRAALENMRMLDKAKDDFMVLISHEVRTPLTAIMGGVDYLRKSVEEVEGQEREILDRLNIEEITGIIRSSGERLSGFMTDAIQMTSMGSADARLDLRPVEVRDVIAQGLCGVAELAAEKGITIHNQLDRQLDWSILCDPEVLGVGFEKILRNAVVHNRPDGVIIIREAVVVPNQGTISELIRTESLRKLEEQKAFRSYEDEDLRWRIVEIFNTGRPIPADRRAALFGKFEIVGRIENHQKGSGLSLPIAKAAVESHGGRIFLDSDEKDGNSFFLMLPTLPGCPLPGRNESGYDFRECIGSAAWDEEVGEPGDAAPFEVELEDLCASILGGIDQAGGGIDGAGGSNHEEEVTVGRRGK